MISAPTGAMALVMVTLVKDHGLQYLLAATLLTGVLQIIAGALRLGPSCASSPGPSSPASSTPLPSSWVLLSGFFFAHKVCKILHVGSKSGDEGRLRRYQVVGQVFYASADTFVNSFDFREVIERVSIDVSRAHFWDITAVSALDNVVVKFRREGAEVEVIGLNDARATRIDSFAIHDKPGAIGIDAQEVLLTKLKEQDAARTKAERELAGLFLNGLRKRTMPPTNSIGPRRRSKRLASTLRLPSSPAMRKASSPARSRIRRSTFWSWAPTLIRPSAACSSAARPRTSSALRRAPPF